MTIREFLESLYRLKTTIPENGYGLIDLEPEPEDFVLGGENQALKVILSRERDYTTFLPTNELQARPFDSYSCVTFSALNCLEIIGKTKYGIDTNWSDRFTAAISGTVAGKGNSLKAVADSIRKFGLVLEEDYQWGGTNNAEYLKKPTKEVIEKGQQFLNIYEVQYEWVDYSGCDPELLHEALIYGPIQVTVNAAATSTGKINKFVNHAVTIYRSEYGKRFHIFDHYARTTYTLPWTFYFGSAMQFSLLKKKVIPLIKIVGKPELYAIFGQEACHILEEPSWRYGIKIGAWKDEYIEITENNFNSRYTVGRPINFK